MTAPTARAEGSPPHGSKAEVAYQLILGKIIDGTYGPGYRLVLDRLASEMGVSAVPIREALRRLEAEGHVDFKRNLGATVCGIDAAEYAERMQTLAILETSATALAAPLVGPADLAAARRANEAVATSLERLDLAAFSQSNHEFHEALYRACPNAHLTDLVEREWTRLFRIRNSGLAFVPERARQAVA
ncbi:MAG: GntR family transcriptional regulator, partial [Micromonosporaceae bacterium]